MWSEIARKPAFSLRDLRIRGEDVIAAMIRRGLAEPGYRGDARVGEALHWLFEQVTDAPERNERGLAGDPVRTILRPPSERAALAK